MPSTNKEQGSNVNVPLKQHLRKSVKASKKKESHNNDNMIKRTVNTGLDRPLWMRVETRVRNGGRQEAKKASLEESPQARKS